MQLSQAGQGLPASLRQHVGGGSVGGSVIHMSEMIVDHLLSSPQIGGDGKEGRGAWCGRLLQGLA